MNTKKDQSPAKSIPVIDPLQSCYKTFGRLEQRLFVSFNQAIATVTATIDNASTVSFSIFKDKETVA